MSTSTSKRSLVCDDDPPSLAVRSGRNLRRATRNSVAVGLGADAAHFAGRARRLPQHENGTTASDLVRENARRIERMAGVAESRSPCLFCAACRSPASMPFVQSARQVPWGLDAATLSGGHAPSGDPIQDV